MKAEMICVGTELLLGQIVNTDAAFIAGQLAEMGIDMYYQTVLGDNAARLSAALELAETRSDLIILTGGLGPTDDDLTKQTVAEHLQIPLVIDERAMAKIRKRFADFQTIPQNNIRQAQVMKGAEILKNDAGLASGDFLKHNGKFYLLLPGPPSELKPMFEKEAKPRLAAYLPKNIALLSRVLRFAGMREARLAEILDSLIKTQTNPTLATYAKDYEVTLRLTAKAATEKEATVMLDEMEQKVRAKVGKYMYGYGDATTLEEVVIQQMIARHVTFTSAESLTAGLFQATAANVAGVSEIFPGGFVTYAEAAKAHLLAIDEGQLKRFGVVSRETAIAMAEGARKKFNTDFAMSFTGVAGPDELEGKPAGTVYAAIATPQKTYPFLWQLPGERNQIRARAVHRMFEALWWLSKK